MMFYAVTNAPDNYYDFVNDRFVRVEVDKLPPECLTRYFNSAVTVCHNVGDAAEITAYEMSAVKTVKLRTQLDETPVTGK
jgi:hypothetical protein